MSVKVITYDEFANKRYTPHKDLFFAATNSLVEIAAAELSKAICSLPVGFIKQEDQFVLVALMGIEQNKNLFVGKDGSWLAGYLPALLRASPFTLASVNTGEKVLCVDDTVQMSIGNDGRPFFLEDKKPDESLIKAMEFLQAFDANRVVTLKAVNALNDAGLIKPWDITIKLTNGPTRLEGLFGVSEAELNKVDKDTLIKLRDAGALVLAYCQMISTQHLEFLARLADAQSKKSQLDLSGFGKDQLDFSFLNNLPKGEN